MDVAIRGSCCLQNETIQESPDDEFISLLNNASPIPHFMKKGWIKKMSSLPEACNSVFISLQICLKQDKMSPYPSLHISSEYSTQIRISVTETEWAEIHVNCVCLFISKSVCGFAVCHFL